MLSKCLLDFQLLLATSVKGLMSPVTWQREGWSLPGFDAWRVFLFEMHSLCAQQREGRMLVHLGVTSAAQLLLVGTREQEFVQNCNQKVMYGLFWGLPSLCPGGQGGAGLELRCEQ